MSQSFRLTDIVGRFGGELLGDGEIAISKVATLASAGPSDLSFLSSGKYRQQLANSGAGAFILGKGDRDATEKPRIVCENPYLYFAKVSDFLNPGPEISPGIHGSAVVHEQTQIDRSSSVGPFCCIEKNARIGKNCSIGASCFIGEGVEIGNDVLIYPGVKIYHGCVIGNNCIIHSGAVIGADGFGIAMDGESWFKIPQTGKVVMGDDVEIGANTTIDRGALDDTIIEKGVKIDNQVQIAHNCVIGEHTAIAGCTGVAGSTKIGKYCKIGGSGMILGHLDITDHVDISAGTMITKSIEAPGAYTAIYPFAPHREWLRNSAKLRHLNDLAERVRRIEKAIESMERKKS
ncbi:MAG TPA: UDP-3-O-(3-hydroxymyristoyl)glucosamine N-acyltransferase [Burkholderiales bacterium]|nr:UDP-3-O-(3-hydroxymyristoyl)glucosamine N-acyltransferase [Burkholderiales bacterium]